jgi:hypothetical protein
MGKLCRSKLLSAFWATDQRPAAPAAPKPSLMQYQIFEGAAAPAAGVLEQQDEPATN